MGADFAVVVCNGEMNGEEIELQYLREASLVIAADGGTRHALRMGVIPHVVIGDLDSLEGEGRDLRCRGVEIIRYPREKDETDAELALGYAIERGFRRLVFLGALGGRVDHGLANLFLLVRAAMAGVDGRLVSGCQEARLLGEGACRRADVVGEAHDLLSLIPIGGPVKQVTTEGLKYPLHGEDLELGSTRGISNEFIGQACAVTCEEGLLLLIHTRQHKG